MSTPHLLLRGIASLILAIGFLATPASAQQDPRALDPSDVFFQAWLTIREAEKLEKEGKFNDARQKFEQAAKYYNVISRYHKNWKPAMVQRRVKTTQESLAKVTPKAVKEIAEQNAKTSGLVEGGAPAATSGGASGHQRQPTTTVKPVSPASSSIANNYSDSINRGKQVQMQQLIRENQQLKNKLEQAKKSAQLNSTAEQQRLIKKIAAKDKEITIIRDVLARAPLQADMDKLEKENKTRLAEIEITARSLIETQERYKKEKLKADEFQRQARESEQRANQIQSDMDEQKKQDNRVVKALTEELKNVTSMLKTTRQELGQVNKRMMQMERSLNESQATISELKKERDALRIERDTLAEILKQNDSSGVRKLISENMRLGKELKEVSDRLEFLSKSNDTTKDELLDAKRDLAVAKTRIMRYQQDQTKHGKRILSLESQLRDAEAELELAQSKAPENNSQDEVDVLKATVKRLIAAQERRKQAEQLLWQAYRKSNNIIPGIDEAHEDILKADVELSDEEKELLTARTPDGEFTNPQRVSAKHARAHGEALQADIADHNRLVKRFFGKGYYDAARQTLADMNERFPGHFPTLCNQGVLELKTNRVIEAVDIFSEAITMRENSSYAHYMLGLSYYNMENFDAATNAFQQSLDLRPGNARAHWYLGNLAGVGRRYEQAEEHLKLAIKLDPMMADAYYNLSVVYIKQKRKTEALDAYKMALKYGSHPDIAHEKRLGL